MALRTYSRSRYMIKKEENTTDLSEENGCKNCYFIWSKGYAIGIFMSCSILSVLFRLIMYHNFNVKHSLISVTDMCCFMVE